MTIEEIYENARRKLDKNEITIGEFAEIVDREVHEPKVGHWIVAKGDSYLGSRNGCCSNCKDFYTNDWDYMNYCPNCGAKMIEPQDKTKQGLAYADQDTLMSAT